MFSQKQTQRISTNLRLARGIAVGIALGLAITVFVMGAYRLATL
jgi:hypothetical protein